MAENISFLLEKHNPVLYASDLVICEFNLKFQKAGIWTQWHLTTVMSFNYDLSTSHGYKTFYQFIRLK